ncbi:MAG: GNAT family protein [Planctomycetota bacterium]
MSIETPPPSQPPAPVIAGERVLLRHPAESDRAEWIELRRESRAFLEPWEPVPPRGVDAFANSGFDRYLRGANASHTQRHLLCLRDGTLIGHVALNQIVRGAFHNAIMGYWIGERFTRRGLMSEGVTLCILRAFEQLGLHRVEANVIPRNEASRRTALRCGLRREGYSPHYLQIAGVWEDHERYAITAEDWRDSSRAGQEP